MITVLPVYGTDRLSSCIRVGSLSLLYTRVIAAKAAGSLCKAFYCFWLLGTPQAVEALHRGFQGYLKRFIE
jgi:hypothetical protein